MMEDTAAEEPLDFRHDENTDQAALIADAADLERFALYVLQHFFFTFLLISLTA